MPRMDAPRWTDADSLPVVRPGDIDHDGEIVTVTIGGESARMRMDEAKRLLSWYRDVAQGLNDAITRAGGIEPRSGEPI